jgi:hypothetical protein
MERNHDSTESEGLSEEKIEKLHELVSEQAENAVESYVAAFERSNVNQAGTHCDYSDRSEWFAQIVATSAALYLKEELGHDDVLCGVYDGCAILTNSVSVVAEKFSTSEHLLEKSLMTPEELVRKLEGVSMQNVESENDGDTDESTERVKSMATDLTESYIETDEDPTTTNICVMVDASEMHPGARWMVAMLAGNSVQNRVENQVRAGVLNQHVVITADASKPTTQLDMSVYEADKHLYDPDELREIVERAQED